MSKNDLWYGFLQAGAKSSPVVRDMSLEDKGRSTIYLYNHARGMFVEYALEVVEPKLRELQPEDIPLNELDNAFKVARKTFSPVKLVKKWNDAAPASPPKENDEPEIEVEMDSEIDDFIDDDDN
jgi:hypothetical protein